jgi:hypothetical protein
MRFRGILKGADPGKLDPWLDDALSSRIHCMREFAIKLRQDAAAVRNAITEIWSNGQVEGQINRLKTLKRAMYGRAGIALLRARMVVTQATQRTHSLRKTHGIRDRPPAAPVRTLSSGGGPRPNPATSRRGAGRRITRAVLPGPDRHAGKGGAREIAAEVSLVEYVHCRVGIGQARHGGAGPGEGFCGDPCRPGVRWAAGLGGADIRWRRLKGLSQDKRIGRKRIGRRMRKQRTNQGIGVLRPLERLS